MNGSCTAVPYVAVTGIRSRYSSLFGPASPRLCPNHHVEGKSLKKTASSAAGQGLNNELRSVRREQHGPFAVHDATPAFKKRVSDHCQMNRSGIDRDQFEGVLGHVES